MTPKERILNGILGKPADRVAWCPNLAYYWDFLPKSVKLKTPTGYMTELGADPLLRGTPRVSHVIYHNCEIRQTQTARERHVIKETPVGTLTEDYVHSDAGNTWFLIKHPVESEEDFKVLQYIYEHLEQQEDLKDFDEWDERIGERALLMPVIGTNLKTPFQSLVEHWCGTANLSYALADFPEVVEECLDVMRERDRENVRIAAKSGAEGFIFWEDSSTTNISPQMFEDYTLPVIREWGDIIHASGKLLVHHACGHLRHLMPLIAKSGIDALESISPPPTGNIELTEIRQALPDNIALIGGIEPTKLLNLSMDALHDHVESILTSMKGTRYVLGNSDSCPPGVDEEKFRMISRLVRQVQ